MIFRRFYESTAAKTTVIIVAIVMLWAVGCSSFIYAADRSRCESRAGTWEGEYLALDFTCTGGIPAKGTYCAGGLAFKKAGIAADPRVPEWDHYCEPTP